MRQLKIGEGAACPVCPEIARNLVINPNVTQEVPLNPDLFYLVLRGTFRVQEAIKHKNVPQELLEERSADLVKGKEQDPPGSVWFWDAKGKAKTIG